MNMNFVAAGVLGLLGLFYAVAPHSVHVSSGIGFGAEHTVHIVVGVVLIAAAAGVFYLGSAKRKKKR